MKQFSTVKDTPERFTELHGEEKREEGERGDPKEKRGVKRGESSLASNQYLFVLHSLEHSERFTEFYREEKREEGDRGYQEEKRRNKKRRDQARQYFLMCAPQSGLLRDVHEVI